MENKLEKKVEKNEDQASEVPFSNTIGFPVVCQLARISALVTVPFLPQEAGEFAIKYLCTGLSADCLEIIYRVYGTDEVMSAGYEDGTGKGPKYSCFEKHLFYDIPKLALKGIKKLAGGK
jgi:hypothetical protein